MNVWSLALAALGRRVILGGLALAVAASASAAIDTYEFASPQQELEYRQLINELRCPKCQNQNIADSNAPLSKDLRAKAYTMLVEEGHTPDEVVNFMVARYGDFVTYRPPLRTDTLLLWLGPVALLIAVFGGMLYWLRQRQREQVAQLLPQEREAWLRETLAVPPPVAGGAAADQKPQQAQSS